MKRAPQALWRRLRFAALLTGGLLLAGCLGGEDDDDNIAGPEDDGVTLDEAVLAQLNSGVEQAFGLLFTGGGSVPGEGGGQITVEGSTFRFEDYSPDGMFFLDGDLTMNLLAVPITVQGDLGYREGDDTGEIVVDMTIDASTEPPTYGGTITIDGQVLDVAALAPQE